MSGATPHTDRAPAWLRHGALVIAAVALGLVFMAYLNPHTVLDLANRVWACF